MPEHFSYSQLSCWLTCQKKYEFRYIQHIPAPGNLNLLRGSAYHNAVAYGYSHLGDDRKLPPIQELLNIYSDTWDEGMVGKITDEEGNDTRVPKMVIGDKNPGQMKDDGIRLLTKYYTEHMPLVLPSEVEVRKTLDLDGIHLLSYVDVIDWHGTVIDHKTSSREKSEQALINDLQSCFYGITINHGPIDFEFHEAICTKAGNININVAPIHRTEDDYEWCKSIIRTAWKQIHSGIFVPNPTSNLCSSEYCGYWSVCRVPRSF